MLATLVETAYTSLGTAEETFRCCDTAFTVHAHGRNARAGVDAAHRTGVALEGTLNAFAEDSAVARLNRTGRVENEHVARIVRRALDYHERTDGVFDVRQGSVEHGLKAYIRGETDTFDTPFADGAVDVTGDTVTAAVVLDLNGLAKGYIVDRAAEALVGFGRRGFVDGGGDIAHPTGPVAIESPYGDEKPLAALDTDWNVASSGGYRRTRGGVDHIYDPTTERVGAAHELVTVVARRDAMEADALATTLSALPRDDALALAERWDGVEALVVHQGTIRRTGGFTDHVLDQ